jgi:uncharacterized protein (TIGR02996 family)
MSEEDGFLAALVADPNDEVTRLVYADWLEERGNPGADYLRTELALSRATPDAAPGLRRKLLEIIPRLPMPWRDRFEQPDLLLAPPVPFATGWYGWDDLEPQPYRSLPNLNPGMLSPDMRWLSGAGTGARVDQAQHKVRELVALAKIQERAEQLNLILPPGFVAFAKDFPRRGAVLAADSGFEVFLHDAVIDPFPQMGDGYLILFFADMNIGSWDQLSWCLYLVPGIDWHCVVVYGVSVSEENETLLPETTFYCAPSFQAFLYRWCLEQESE